MKVHLTQKSKMFILACLSFCLLFPLTVFAETDVTDLVEIQQSRLRYDRRTGTSSTQVCIKNISEEVLLTPIKVVIDDISDPSVSVSNADGYTEDGKPYFEYGTVIEQLQSGDMTKNKLIKFDNSEKQRFGYSLKVIKLVSEINGKVLSGALSGVKISMSALDGNILAITDTNSYQDISAPADFSFFIQDKDTMS